MSTSDHPRKIGFMLASIHTGSSNNLWAVLADMASRSGDALYVFPGGRLECRDDFEYLRSSVYSLANTDNLDGLISWGSSLGGFVPVSEVLRFHEQFEGLPYVTIGLKKEGHPDISFDAYAGLKSEILHCISVHGAKKIAFIRGPENHLSAEDRYHAYLDTLRECHIPVDERLISEPTPWSSGEQALEQLVVERNLVPGIDFDTLVCASDLMMFRAGKRLEEMGVTIPDDLRIVGFNDSHESQLLRVPCTTVGMPFAQMGIMAWDSLGQMLRSDKWNQGGPDVLLPADLLVRRSCGCEDSLGGPEKAATLIIDKISYLKWVKKTFHLTEESLNQKILPLIDCALEVSISHEPSLSKQLEREFASLLFNFFGRNGDINLLYEALRWLCLFLPVDEAFKAFVAERLQPLIGKTQNRVFNLNTFESGRRARRLNSLKCDLLCIRSLSGLAEVLHAHLPGLGVDAAFVILNGDEDFSQFVGGFADDYVTGVRQEFPHRELLPPDISARLEGGVYVVEPLFMENQPLGYLVIRTISRDGGMFEELRSSLSSAIKGTFLLEVANQAREQAERAERSRTEFFANVSDGLRNPLHAILQLVDVLKIGNSAETSHAEMAQAIEKELSTANHLIDLTLSQTGELELDIRICDPMRVLEERCHALNMALEMPVRLPAVRVDESRLSQILDIINRLIVQNGGVSRLSVQLVPEGLRLVCTSSESGWDPRMTQQDPGLLLAERIMMMHDGRFAIDFHSVQCIFPWPTLSGENRRVPHEVEGPVWYIVSDLERECEPLPAGFPAFAKVPASLLVRDETPLTAPSFLVWDVSDVCYETFAALRILRKDLAKNRIPFLCFGAPENAVTLGDAIESVGQSFGGGAVFLYGDVLSGLMQLAPSSDFISLESLENYASLAGDYTPGLLIVTRDISVDDIEAVRKLRVGGTIPILLMRDMFDVADVERLCLLPRVLVCNSCMAESDGFSSRIRGLLGGDDILPPLTGALVKRAVVYLSRHATNQISRWQLAEAVNVSEDYLTRIFRKELGLSPWDYLNRYRIHLASEMLRQTAMTINEVASRTGFQDQAYFCRVFKKVKGCPPGKVRGR